MSPVQQGAESTEDLLVRDRAVRLFTFLKELTELRSKTTRSCDRYDRVLWFHEIPRDHGCHCIAWRAVATDELSDVWVEVKQPRFKKPPEVPERIKAWVNPHQIEDSQLESPKLRERILVQKPGSGTDHVDVQQTEVIELVNSAEIPPLFETYVKEKWMHWAEDDRKLRAVQQVYSDLFSIYQKQQRLGEAYEVVLGLGCLVWRLPSGQDVKRHVITAQVSLSFDPERGIIAVGPAADGPRPTLEQDMLEPGERPDVVEQRLLEGQVDEIGDAVWDGTKVPTALRSWVHAVSPGGQYEEVLEVGSAVITDKPTIYLAPALILRARTDQRFLKVFQEIINQLRNGEEIPLGVRRLVTIMDDRSFSSAEGDERGRVSGESEVKEVFFPLPANREQEQIVRVLGSRQGILVQGPPGTGKSHTITNLICHLLATGKRVLITSHTQRALRVILDKFQNESYLKGIADLCVILLGDDLESRKALEDSVQSIVNHHNGWDEHESTRLIERLSGDLSRARQSEAQTLQDLRALRERETFRHTILFEAYSGTAQDIAIRVRAEDPTFRWINTKPHLDQQPPLSDEEATELLNLLRSSSPDDSDLKRSILSIDEILSPSEFEALVEEESALKVRHNSLIGDRSHAAHKGMCKLSSEVRAVFLDKLTHLIASFEGLTRHIHAWAGTAVTQILGDRDRAWRELAATTRKHLELIDRNRRILRDRKVTGCKGRNLSDVKDDAAELLVHLENGGSLGFLWLRPRIVRRNRYIIDEIRIDGQPCDNPGHVEILISWLNTFESLEVLRQEWSHHTNPPSGTLLIQIAEYQDLCEPIDSGLQLLQEVRELRDLVSPIKEFYQPAWHNLKELHDLRNVGNALYVEESLRVAKDKLASLENGLRQRSMNPAAHPSGRELVEAVKERNPERYHLIVRSIASLHRRREGIDRRQELFNRLRTVSPSLAEDLAARYADVQWDDRMASFSTAWNWARANRWINEFSDPTLDRRLTLRLDDSRKQVQELLGQLASQWAWAYCMVRIGESQRQHLVAWRKAVERIGKGKGKAAYVAKNREDARNHMQACRSAIPAWIMPIYRVAESFIPGKDAFDVVIVDEASQSGPEALFLQYLAKQIIVVGDDKQISPDHVGLTKGDVDLLRERNIKDIPFNDSLGIEHSFFDQAELRYGGRIRLREHFRCMPEIIQFSNNLCYEAQPLIPLRQHGSARLTPVLVSRHVGGGYQRGHSPRVDNPAEAKAIAEQIRLCCQEPGYDGKSMGVISLLGENQARLIEQYLIDLIGPAEIKRRDIICGDAYAFQGDERDVMFLSLVSAVVEGKRVGTLSGAKDERRFNVAASRARDQMWLFHSATLNDLNPQCLRYRLLSYVSNPQVKPIVLGGLTIEHLRTVAARADRRNDRPPRPLDSWFEVDVYLKIAFRGFRVIPQFEVAGYFIDLLVEGMKGRLAIECDGDEVHGIDRFDADMARQRMLERCGLNFWRIRASTFYRDEDAAMEELWAILAQRSINPANSETAIPIENVSDSSTAHAVHVSSDLVKSECKGDVESEEINSKLSLTDSWFKSEQPTIQNKLFPLCAQAPQDQSYEPLGAGLISNPPSWFRLSHWGKLSQQLSPYLNRFSYNIGQRLNRRTTFTEKQIKLAPANME